MTRPHRNLIAVAGSLAQRPGIGGHAWVMLQYVLGFRRLGFDVLFLDALTPDMCVDRGGNRCGFEQSWNLQYFSGVMGRFGIAHSLDFNGERFVGIARDEVIRGLSDRGLLLLNVMGFLKDPAVRDAAPPRVFLDIDPGFGQMWKALGQADVFADHDRHVTIAERIGKPDCTIPACGVDWITTRQPVVLDQWPVAEPMPQRPFTSVASWRGAFAPVEFEGNTYGLRVHEFRKFFELPARTGRPFEVALKIDSVEHIDLAALKQHDWRLADPREVADTPDAYQSYVRNSAAEIMIAKNMYVQTRGGWFSDRSICYLATGRPVLAQDTGLSELYSTGEGLLTFKTLDDAVAGVESIDRDYARHCRAARAVAEESFDSDKVLTELLSKLDVEVPTTIQRPVLGAAS
jgi:hypothetical protein